MMSATRITNIYSVFLNTTLQSLQRCSRGAKWMRFDRPRKGGFTIQCRQPYAPYLTALSAKE